MRWVAIKNFGNGIKTGLLLDVLDQRLTVPGNGLCVVKAIPSTDERTNQPTPNCTLVISAIAVQLIADIVTDVVRVGWVEASQTIGSQEAIARHPQNPPPLSLSKPAMIQRQRQNCIRTNPTVPSVIRFNRIV